MPLDESTVQDSLWGVSFAELGREGEEGGRGREREGEGGRGREWEGEGGKEGGGRIH